MLSQSPANDLPKRLSIGMLPLVGKLRKAFPFVFPARLGYKECVGVAIIRGICTGVRIDALGTVGEFGIFRIRCLRC